MTVTMQPDQNVHFTGSDCVKLAALSNSPKTARIFVRKLLERWNMPDSIGTAELLATELVTNAIKAVGMVEAYPAPRYTAIRNAPTISLCIYRQRELLVMEVWDPSPKPPMPIAAGPTDESGRGLALVMAFATAYGYRRPRTALGGKVVWCTIKT